MAGLIVRRRGGAHYDDYFWRAAASRAHARFCELVYGRDLCQHGMRDVAEMTFLAGLLKPDENILEIGCANGRMDRDDLSGQGRERSWEHLAPDNSRVGQVLNQLGFPL